MTINQGVKMDKNGYQTVHMEKQINQGNEVEIKCEARLDKTSRRNKKQKDGKENKIWKKRDRTEKDKLIW